MTLTPDIVHVALDLAAADDRPVPVGALLALVREIDEAGWRFEVREGKLAIVRVKKLDGDKPIAWLWQERERFAARLREVLTPPASTDSKPDAAATPPGNGVVTATPEADTGGVPAAVG